MTLIKKYTFWAFACLFLSALCFFCKVRQEQEALAANLAPSVLRFHILADSDRNADQRVKLEVRSLILDYLGQALSPTATKEDTVNYLTEHVTTVEALANEYLKKQGFSYQAQLELTNCYFPMKAYGNMTFPAGYYDAARIILGKGQGHNWWCVLYPRFCFVDATCSEIPGETLTQLQEGLKQDDYLALQDSRPEVKIRFFLFPMLNP